MSSSSRSNTCSLWRSTSSPQTFHLFPLLPPELRQKIFSHAHVSRILPLDYSTSDRKFTSPTATPPPLLSVSHEARLETLRSYRLSFGTSTQPAEIYFNPYMDTIYIPRHNNMGYDSSLRDFRVLATELEHGKGRGRPWSLDEVRSIAIDYVKMDIKRPWESYNKSTFIRSFPNLEEIVLVIPAVRPVTVHHSPPPNRLTLDAIFRGVSVIEEYPNDVVGDEDKMGFRSPTCADELVLRCEAGFARGIKSEETLRMERCARDGITYVPYTLPHVRVMEKVR